MWSVLEGTNRTDNGCKVRSFALYFQIIFYAVQHKTEELSTNLAVCRSFFCHKLRFWLLFALRLAKNRVDRLKNLRYLERFERDYSSK